MITKEEREILIQAQFDLDAIMWSLKDINFTGPAMDIQFTITKIESLLAEAKKVGAI